MRKVVATFGGRAYDRTTELIVTRAPKMGADEVWVYDDAWLIKQEFRALNSWLWEHHGDANNNKRGFGWFAWKPFVIMHALDRLNDGDFLLYLDADTYPIADFSALFDACTREGGIMLFAAEGCWHGHWCKRDCYIVMGQDEPAFTRENVQHGVARFLVFQKGSWRNRQFLMEWLAYCLNPLATTFDPSVILPEYPDNHLREHRTEQAIMTNLAHKYGIPLHREACQAGEESQRDRDLYPQLFEQRDLAGDKGELQGSAWRNIE